MYILVYTLFTTTLHFPSGQISLATPASLSSAHGPLLEGNILPASSLSLLDRQTTQALLGTSKLLQPRVYIMHIAATQAIHCCSVTAARWEARTLEPLDDVKQKVMAIIDWDDVLEQGGSCPVV